MFAAIAAIGFAAISKPPPAFAGLDKICFPPAVAANEMQIIIIRNFNLSINLNKSLSNLKKLRPNTVFFTLFVP